MHAKQFVFCGLLGLLGFRATGQTPGAIRLRLEESKTYQTIDNFAASDAWACQFVGNWPDDKRNQVADWLFSIDTFANGNPKGIGLTMWRYNLGAGSAGQKDSSGIKDEWRRAPATGSNSPKTAAQNWFLKAASVRGVQQFLGFFNSPPVQLTKNGKAFADKGQCNIDSSRFEAFAAYTVASIKQIKQATGIDFDYISPVNEPQWDWSDGGQEGCPYNNQQISGVVKAFSRAFKKEHLDTRLLIAEAGQLQYLLPAKDRQDKDNQVADFFHPASPTYIGNLPNVAPVIASHSYFTTSPYKDAISLRSEVNNAVSHTPHLRFWQSEYCILGDNAGEINGSGKDLGMNAALYIAKVIHEDLTAANAAAWQWWTALSAYDYKDGLVYIEKAETDGAISDSKMLWAMGNYSRFIRPGMQRIEVTMPATEGVYLSAFKQPANKERVCVLVNESDAETTISIDNEVGTTRQTTTVYTTDATNNLAKRTVTGNNIVLPAKSVTTVVMK